MPVWKAVAMSSAMEVSTSAVNVRRCEPQALGLSGQHLRAGRGQLECFAVGRLEQVGGGIPA